MNKLLVLHATSYTKKCLLFLALIMLLFISPTQGQKKERTQNIQGTISDDFTGATIPGANVVLIKDSVQLWTFSTENGSFYIEKVPLGKFTLAVSCIGFTSYTESNLNLTAGKALILDIKLTPANTELAEININAPERKNQAINKMALIGARSFNLEETNRYAGSYGDPARMAMNYAGVLPVRDNRNDIIVRGNSAVSLQWRIDDIEIPNPNHFGASGTTGGPITIINTNLLSKSDFFNGTFPAQYGNAIAGIFDLKTKAANTMKHERWFQIGWNGVELGFEGPFKKGKKASYMISYRHGIPDILYQLGVEQQERVMYKDLSFKLNFPGTKTGNWSIIGMGGNSQIVIDELDYDEADRTFETYGEQLDNYTAMGAAGIVNRIYPSSKSKITNSLSITGSSVKNVIDTFTVEEKDPFLWAKEDTKEIKLSLSTRINQRINNTSSLTYGAIYDHFFLSYNDVEYMQGDYVNYTDTSNAQASLIRAHAAYKKLLGARFESTIGIYGQYFIFNKTSSIEPRASLKFNMTEKASLAYGIGLHSQTQPKMVYFVQTPTANNTYAFTNKDLDFSKNIQQSVSYNHLLSDFLNLKIEAYYQYLYDVPVGMNQAEYSLINFGTEYYVERKDSLINNGKGQNYGIEFTLEQYLHRNFFYMLTASLFESNYTGNDNKKRNTAYNGRYALNALAGYELTFPKKYVSMIFGINLTYAGGSPYVPFDQEATIENGRATYDWEKAYTVKREDYKRISLRLGIRRSMKKSSIETTFDLQYRSDYTSIYLERIDVTTGEIINTNNMGFYPMINMRINF